jgi:hypothetical protein
MIKFLQCKPTGVLKFIKITKIIHNTSPHMFRASRVHHQGGHNCIKQLLTLSRNGRNSSTCVCVCVCVYQTKLCTVIGAACEHIQNKNLLQVLRTTLSATYILHIEEFSAVLLHAGNENFKQLFYTTVYSLKMGL